MRNKLLAAGWAALALGSLGMILAGCGMGSGGSRDFLNLPIPPEVLRSRSVAAIQYDRVILELMAETVELWQDLAAGYRGLPPKNPRTGDLSLQNKQLGRFNVTEDTLNIPNTGANVNVTGRLKLTRPREQAGNDYQQTLELDFDSGVQCLVNSRFFQLAPIRGTANLTITAPRVTRASRGEVLKVSYWETPLQFPPLKMNVKFEGSFGGPFKATATLDLKLPKQDVLDRTTENVVLIDTAEGLAPAVYLTNDPDPDPDYTLELQGTAQSVGSGVQESLDLKIAQATFAPDTFTVQDPLHLQPVRLEGTRTIDLGDPARPVVTRVEVKAQVVPDPKKKPETVVEGELRPDGQFLVRNPELSGVGPFTLSEDTNQNGTLDPGEDSNGNGRIDSSVELPSQRPQPPQNFIAIRKGTVVELSWSASPEASNGYILQYRDSSTGSWTPLFTGTGTSYTDQSVNLNIHREYRLFVVRGVFTGPLDADQFKDVRTLSRPAIARPAAFTEPGDLIY